MEKKKVATILAIIAVVFVVTAIALSITESDLQTSRGSESPQPGSGEVGVEIASGEIEDKLNQANQETSQ